MIRLATITLWHCVAGSGRHPPHHARSSLETESHLFIAHEVTNSGWDRTQPIKMGKQAKAVPGAAKLNAPLVEVFQALGIIRPSGETPHPTRDAYANPPAGRNQMIAQRMN